MAHFDMAVDSDDAFPYALSSFLPLPKRDPPPPADAHINGEDWGDFLMCAMGVCACMCVCACACVCVTHFAFARQMS